VLTRLLGHEMKLAGLNGSEGKGACRVRTSFLDYRIAIPFKPDGCIGYRLARRVKD
jgi:hypothetical protein